MEGDCDSDGCPDSPGAIANDTERRMKTDRIENRECETAAAGMMTVPS